MTAYIDINLYPVIIQKISNQTFDTESLLCHVSITNDTSKPCVGNSALLGDAPENTERPNYYVSGNKSQGENDLWNITVDKIFVHYLVWQNKLLWWNWWIQL